jgi:hypothetical protein
LFAGGELELKHSQFFCFVQMSTDLTLWNRIDIFRIDHAIHNFNRPKYVAITLFTCKTSSTHSLRKSFNTKIKGKNKKPPKKKNGQFSFSQKGVFFSL